MHDAEIVRGLQGVGHLAEDVHGARHLEGAFALQQVGERLAFDVLHREVDQPLGRFAEIVNRADVGVGDAARVGRLAVEPRHGIGVVHH